MGLGMDYERQPGCRFEDREDFKEARYQFRIARDMLERFEEVAARVEPPYDPRALTGGTPDPPVRDCSWWVDEVLQETRDSLTA